MSHWTNPSDIDRTILRIEETFALQGSVSPLVDECTELLSSASPRMLSRFFRILFERSPQAIQALLSEIKVLLPTSLGYC